MMARFTVARDALEPALSRAVAVVPNVTAIPILNTAKFDAGPSGLIVTASDLGVALEERVDTEPHSAWCGCIDAERFAGFVKSLPRGGGVDIEADDRRVEVRQNRAVARLSVMPPADFPIWQTDEHGEAVCEIAGAELIVALRRLAPTMSAQQLRLHICGVCLHGDEDGGAVGVATDGNRLTLHRLPLTLTPDTSIIVPRETVTRLLPMLRGFTDTVQIGLSSRLVEFTCGPWTLRSKLIDGTFPAYARVLPPRLSDPVLVDCAALATAVKRVQLIAGDTRSSTPVKLAVADGWLRVTATSEKGLGDAEDAISAQGGAADPIGLNGRYVEEALEGLAEAATVELHITSGAAPIWICAAGELHDGVVVMPMRI